jgi:hypothetical protein
VAAFEADDSVGAVASTVFYARNPLVINGAGGTVNRQGWAADISMNESYEHAELPVEALYPMGCGMAIRRSVLERVGSFDPHIVNYYDDVDYGIRVWRNGYRVVVAADACIDHDFNPDGSDSSRKQLLCERHRVRVVLSHAPVKVLPRWTVNEARALLGASADRRKRKQQALAWNAWRLPSMLTRRHRLRRTPPAPDRLVAPTWGNAFPVHITTPAMPRPALLTDRIDMASADSEAHLIHGWFPTERLDGRCHRWTEKYAAALIELKSRAMRLRLDYTHTPADNGGIDIAIRRADSELSIPVWSTHLHWQYLSRTVENHPVALSPGTYEVLFNAACTWSEPPRETRQLGFALARLSFEVNFALTPGGLDMASPAVDDQLLYGWFEPEESEGRHYRWTCANAAMIVRLAQGARAVKLRFRMPPRPTGKVCISVTELAADRSALHAEIDWRDDRWREQELPVGLLAPGDYVISFDAEATWSNPVPRDPALPPEGRALGIAVSELTFV